MSTKVTPEQLGAEIVRQSALYLNLLETRPNAEWDNPSTPAAEKALSDQLRDVMKEAGWEPGWAYCIAFAEGMVILACRRLGFAEPQISKLRKLINPHVMTTARTLKAAGLLDQEATSGAIWLARHGKTDKGHAGIVTSPNHPDEMVTIEGNTTSTFKGSAKDRQGDGIFVRNRDIYFNGDLKTQGFFNPVKMMDVLNS